MKNLKVIAAFILIACFTLTSCQKEGIENLTENTDKTATEFNEQNFPSEDLQLDLDELKKQAESRMKELHTDIDLEDQEEIKALVEAYHFREIKSASYNEKAQSRSADVVRFESFWWGYHIVIPQSAMLELEKSDDLVLAFIGMAGAAIAASGGTLAPFVAMVAPVVALQYYAMKQVNQGRGVYLSALWIFPFNLVPTAI